MSASVQFSVVTLILLAMPLAVLACDRSAEEDLPEVHVWLGKPVTSVRGREWPRHDDGRHFSITGDSKDRHVTVYLPSDDSISVTTTSLFMAEEDQKVAYVAVTPRPEMFPYRYGKLVRFGQAIAELERVAKEMRVEDHPRLRRKIAEWKEETPESGPTALIRAVNVEREPGVELRFSIKSDILGDGWYIAVGISALEFYERNK